MLEISYFGALFAGLLSFFTPCILPMVPFYLSYMGGLSMAELRNDGAIAPGAQRRLILSAFCFAAGVTTVFMLMGMGATALGQLFGQYMDILAYGAAALLVLFEIGRAHVELQSHSDLVCRLLLEKKKQKKKKKKCRWF